MTRAGSMFVTVTAAAVTALGLASAAPATAASATAHTVAGQVTAVDRAGAAALDVYRGRYVTQGGCETAGRQGVERGHWDQYQCAEGRLFRHLWTNR
ncbi:hypothetical protein [Streptomyces sp. HM190]|uniref:hypothetical protein n=1 Tax=Streptomyces sp. HM190 TaxID=2695266 RepID=UPI001F326F88|nr:hypothetical protein [Streptomyces sp. HM190]